MELTKKTYDNSNKRYEAAHEVLFIMLVGISYERLSYENKYTTTNYLPVKWTAVKMWSL